MVDIPGNVYLVGGAVRDKFLKINEKPSDRDWVVTGTTSQAMLQAGFKPVGRAFPVFLHPDTHEEYALARTETKTGPGHSGFEINADENVSLIDDLHRRDLSINAMAIDPDGNLIDPFNGRRDLDKKTLRHVSSAFSEDPLRVYRVARFAASLSDFQVHPETIKKMSTMSDELSDLPAERVWDEYVKAMAARSPYRFFETLEESDCVRPWFGDLSVTDLTAVLRERELQNENAVGAIGWTHGPEETTSLLRNLKAPSDSIRLAHDIARFGRALCDFRSMRSEEVLSILERSQAFRQGESFTILVKAVESISGSNLEYIPRLVARLRKVRLRGVPANEYGARLRESRRQMIAKTLKID